MACPVSVSIELGQTKMRAESPRSFCTSPSSISDVDFSHSSSASVINKVKEESGDKLKQPEAVDGMRVLGPSSDYVGINKTIAHPLISSQSLKREADEQTEEEHRETKKCKIEKELTPAEEDSDYLPTDLEEEEEGSYGRTDSTRDDFADGVCSTMDSPTNVDCSSRSPRRRSRRTLFIEYWSRTDECKERKWDHLDEIAEKYGSAEEHIFATTLKGRTACLEPNMFPYDTPAGIEHWTLWHVKELDHEQVKQYVENWIDANAPHVKRWNYDDNPERSIDIFHVHVYFQVTEGFTVLQDRKVEDLMHELD